MGEDVQELPVGLQGGPGLVDGHPGQEGEQQLRPAYHPPLTSVMYKLGSYLQFEGLPDWAAWQSLPT